jgi:hypothetical protein
VDLSVPCSSQLQTVIQIDDRTWEKAMSTLIVEYPDSVNCEQYRKISEVDEAANEEIMRGNDQQFVTIEGTAQYLALLSNKIDEVLDDASGELLRCKFNQHRSQTWQMVLYTMKKLSSHIEISRKLMTDLDALRNVLDGSSAQTDAHVQCV